MKKILITGATGQFGVELTLALAEIYGPRNIVATGFNGRTAKVWPGACHYLKLDVRDAAALHAIIEQYQCNVVYHMAALLSAVAETTPLKAWDINVNGLLNVLEAARIHRCSVFFPSSIAAFGPETPRIDTPQDTIQRPKSLYGIGKLTGELLCDYYFTHFGVDTRGIRFPGLISHKVAPGGGTTDYAVEMFYGAVKSRHYHCYLRGDTQLEMMYMPDAVSAAIKVMNADPGDLHHRNAYNLAAMSFTPDQLAAEIRKYIPSFTISYTVDPVRQAIADSWPQRMNDTAARSEWGWEPRYEFPEMVQDMLEKISVKSDK